MNAKILVTYHKDAPRTINPICAKYPDVFVPILGGACSCRKGTDPFYDCLLRDDQGTNISGYNQHVNEHTVLYWAYKHLDQLKHPDIIGHMHYRRYLDLDYTNLDPTKIYVKRCKRIVFDYFVQFFGREMGYPVFTLLLDHIVNLYPSYRSDIELLLQEPTFYDKNIFVMNIQYFHMYMEFMLPLERMMYHPSVLEDIKLCRPGNQDAIDRYLFKRGRSYLAEFCSALFFEHMRRLGYPVVSTPVTKGSYIGN